MIDYNNVDSLDSRNLLLALTKLVETGVPFYHTRFNAGEALAMSGAANPAATTLSGENKFTDEAGEAMLATLIGVIQGDCPPKPLYLGSYYKYGKLAPRNYYRPSRRLRTIVMSIKASPNLIWCPPGIWYCAELEQINQHPGVELMGLLKAINQRSKQLPNLYIGGPRTQSARNCLGAKSVEVPASNAYSDKEALNRILQACTPNTLCVWAAGFAGKIWAWQVQKHFPNTSHVDVGHLFDAAFGLRSRDWMLCRTLNRIHLQYYTNVIEPYILSFV